MSDRLMRPSALCAWLLIAVSILAGGCLGRSPGVRHFMLGTSESTSTLARAPDMAVLVGPARLPAYLDRSQIATLEGGGEISLDEFNRWLGGFEENLLRALSLGLARELGSTKIVVAPSKAPFEIDYQIRLHVDDLIFEDAGGLRIRIRWALIPIAEEGSPGLFVTDEFISMDGNSVESVVGAHENALMDLVRRIADELVARESDG
jgi:uncharacterized lipoprotein YmbA